MRLTKITPFERKFTASPDELSIVKQRRWCLLGPCAVKLPWNQKHDNIITRDSRIDLELHHVSMPRNQRKRRETPWI